MVQDTKIRTIVADPPWNERGAGKSKRGADKHYPLMKRKEIAKVMVEWIKEEDLHENLHLYLWVTNNFLADGIWLVEHLGFRYITNLAWAKPSFGLGRYFRGQHELCLFATRGRGFDVRTEVNDVSSLIEAPKRLHSQKPDEFYRVVEKRSQGRYLELFSRRTPKKGWTMKGNQLGIIK